MEIHRAQRPPLPSETLTAPGGNRIVHKDAPAPAAFALGLVWLVSPALVFIIGAGFAFASLMLSQMVPGDPQKGLETVFTRA